MKGLGDLFFELSNDDRLSMIRRLKEAPMNLTNLSKKLEITNQECSRHMTRLVDAGIATKYTDGSYSLTPFGRQIIAQLNGMDFTVRFGNYFKDHSIMGIPETFVYRLGELSNCRLVDDVMIVFKNIENMINSTQEYILRITDRFLLTTIPYMEKAYQRGVWQHLLDPEDIIVPPDFDNGPILSDAIKKRQFIDRTLTKVDLFLAMNEKEVSALSFPLLNGKFDYTGFCSRDPAFHKWCKELFEHYWNQSRPKTIDWLQKKVEESRKREQTY